MKLPFAEALVLTRVGHGDEKRRPSAEEGQELMLSKEGFLQQAPGRMTKIKSAEVKERKAKGFGGCFREGLRVQALLGQKRCPQGEPLLLGMVLRREQHGLVELPLRLKACGNAALALAIHHSPDL